MESSIPFYGSSGINGSTIRRIWSGHTRSGLIRRVGSGSTHGSTSGVVLVGVLVGVRVGEGAIVEAVIVLYTLVISASPFC